MGYTNEILEIKPFFNKSISNGRDIFIISVRCENKWCLANWKRPGQNTNQNSKKISFLLSYPTEIRAGRIQKSSALTRTEEESDRHLAVSRTLVLWRPTGPTWKWVCISASALEFPIALYPLFHLHHLERHVQDCWASWPPPAMEIVNSWRGFSGLVWSKWGL